MSNFHPEEDLLREIKYEHTGNAYSQSHAIHLFVEKAINEYTYEDSPGYYYYKSASDVTVVNRSGIKGVKPEEMQLRRANVLNYDGIDEFEEYLDPNAIDGECVFKNFLGVYKPYIAKLTEEALIEECKDFYNETSINRLFDVDDKYLEWNKSLGVNSKCLLRICKRFKLSMYVFDYDRNCFLKNLLKDKKLFEKSS